MDKAIEGRMSEDALKEFERWSKSKSDAQVKKMLAAISEAGFENRNGRIFLETVKHTVKS